MRSVYWNVAPRYTAGSPAMVSETIARRVAKQEQDAIIAAREGAFGEKAQEMAERLGLAGIVWSSLETRKGVIITDLLTGEARVDLNQRK